MCAVIYMVRT